VVTLPLHTCDEEPDVIVILVTRPRPPPVKAITLPTVGSRETDDLRDN
jgi:hypothetical protein